MLKENDKITVHLINTMCSTPTEIKTENAGEIYTIEKVNGKLGFYWNDEEFSQFKCYSWNVIFKNINDKKMYRYSEIKQGLEDVTNLQDGFIDKIKWL